jgi:uncharacterized membrane protein
MSVIDVRATRDIARPRSDVFHYMGDLATLPLWLDGVKEARSLNGDPRKVGAIIAHRNEYMGQRFESAFEVIGWERERSMTFKALSGPIRGQSRETFEAVADDVTRVEIRVTGDVLPPLGANRWLAARIARRQLERSLDSVKRLLEADE